MGVGFLSYPYFQCTCMYLAAYVKETFISITSFSFMIKLSPDAKHLRNNIIKFSITGFKLNI